MQGIFYNSPRTLRIVDQLLLPHREEYITITTVEQTYDVIKKMQIRGAPAIAIIAMLGLSVHLHHHPSDVVKVDEFLVLLSKSRPTAVNLFNAISELEGLIHKAEDKMTCIKTYAESLWKEDKILCDKIASNGVHWITTNVGPEDIVAITICNTGSLATAGCGTALGIIKKLHGTCLLNHCYFLETRPYNQGARLTSVELLSENIPCTMICDSMAGFLMKKLVSEHKNVVVLVGADRITEECVFNKIGTLNLAILSQFYRIPFLVAAPSTSFAQNEKSEIEERPANELKTISGLFNNKDIVIVKIAPDALPVWNPAFDVVDRDLVTAVISEK